MIEAPLAPYRALDLCDERGLFCGRILADFGVDVIQVEPSGGNPARSLGPFGHDIPDPEKSLYWFCYAANKKGITLNIESRDAKEIFKRLVKTADFVIESFPPGYLDSIGLSYSSLAEVNPKIVMTSITPFGQEGPYKDFKGSDLICWSMGGYTWIVGEPDLPPVQISFPQAYLHGSAEAAAATLIAHYHRLRTGKGQHVDVSIQASVARDLMNAPLFWALNKVILKRSGPSRVGLTVAAKQKLHLKCKDGYVTYLMLGGVMGARDNRNLVEYMDSDGACPQYMKEIDWREFDMSTASQEIIDSFIKPIESFFKTHTKEELYQEAIRRRMTIYPVATVKDISEDPQLEARQFWEEVNEPELGNIKLPGAPAKLSETPCVKRRRAPHIGEHNREIYIDELGYTNQDLVILKQGGVI